MAQVGFDAGRKQDSLITGGYPGVWVVVAPARGVVPAVAATGGGYDLCDRSYVNVAERPPLVINSCSHVELNAGTVLILGQHGHVQERLCEPGPTVVSNQAMAMESAQQKVSAA